MIDARFVLRNVTGTLRNLSRQAFHATIDAIPTQRAKCGLLRRLGVLGRVGRMVTIVEGVRWTHGANVFLDDHVLLNRGCFLDDAAEIHIGFGSMIACGASLLTATHDSADMRIVVRDIRVGRCCWVGANALILPGITVGDFAIVGAGSVVVQDVPPYAVVAGNPARVIKQRVVRAPYHLASGARVADLETGALCDAPEAA